MEQAQSWSQHANSIPWEPSSSEKCFLFKSEWMLDERLKVHAHTVSDTLHGADLLGSPDCNLLLDLIWGQTQGLMVRAPSPGLLPDLNVLIFSLFSLPFNGEYAKKAHCVYSVFLTSLHRHLDSTWQKTGSLVWPGRVRNISSSISSSTFSLAHTYEVPILCEKPLSSAELLCFSRKIPFQ